MPYLPKSKFSIKNTAGSELVYKSNNQKIYIGDYILTSTGKYYEGTNNLILGNELILMEDFTNVSKVFGSSKDVKKHKIFKKNIVDFLKNTTPIPLEKPYPTDKDYKNGFFKRYFAKRINGNIFIEISSKTYDDLKKKNPKYDHNLYEAGSLIWHLIGNVFLLNTTSIRQTQKIFQTINYHFTQLDEYKLQENLLQTHLYTEGNELYLANGKDYIGEYHIYEKGPMVGSTHTEEDHPKLYYVRNLPIPKNTTYEDFLKSELAPPQKRPNKKSIKPSNINIPQTKESTRRSGY